MTFYFVALAQKRKRKIGMALGKPDRGASASTRSAQSWRP
jgi:hypothetical protein